MKVVLDTNVLLSGILARGVCEAVLDAVLSSPRHTLVLSDHILEEFSRKVLGKLKVPEDKVRLFIDLLRERAQIVEPAVVPKDACRDRKDLPVIGTAIAAGAAVLVTGDADLLSLGRFGDILIVSPRAFYERIR